MSTVSIYDDFSSCKTTVSHWSTDYETASWVNVDFSVVIDKVSWNNFVDYFSTNTFFYIYEGGVLKQKVQMHTSCSAPLIRGETFGGVRLDDYSN